MRGNLIHRNYFLIGLIAVAAGIWLAQPDACKPSLLAEEPVTAGYQLP